MGEKVVFFRFPRKPDIRKEWIRICNKGDGWTPENKRICNKHFTEDDYEDYVKARLLDICPKKLRKTAIPSVSIDLLNGPENSKLECYKTYKRLDYFKSKKPIIPIYYHPTKDKLIKNQSVLNLNNINFETAIERKRKRRHDAEVTEEIGGNPEVAEKIVIEIIPSTYDSELEKLQNKYDQLLEAHKKLQNQYQQATTSLNFANEQNTNLQQLLRNYEDNFKSNIRQVLSTILKSNQLEDLIEEKWKSIISHCQ